MVGPYMVIKIVKFLTLSLLLVQTCFAFEEMTCLGGIKRQNYTSSIYLGSEGHPVEGIWSGSLRIKGAVIDFYVENNNNGHFYKAKMQDLPEYIINENVLIFPASRSKKINDDLEIFIECRPFTVADYCRIHTC